MVVVRFRPAAALRRALNVKMRLAAVAVDVESTPLTICARNRSSTRYRVPSEWCRGQDKAGVLGLQGNAARDAIGRLSGKGGGVRENGFGIE